MGLWDWSGPQDLDWASAVRSFQTTGDLAATQPRYKHEVVIALDTGIKYQGDQPVIGGWVLATGAPAVLPFSTYPNQYNTGYVFAPGYPGVLSPAVAVSSGNTYNFKDFDGGLGLSSVNNVTFNGCRFRNNGTFNMRMTNSSNIVFNYCSAVPMAALPPVSIWPSAGAGMPVDGIDASQFPPYMLASTLGPLYNMRMDGVTGCGGIVFDHCDIWGGAIGIDFAGTLDCIVRDCWVHDCRNPIAQDDHSNGTSYVDGLGGRSNISILRSTIASLGNTNGIGFQAASTPYSNLILRGNYLSGFGYTLDMGHNVSGNNNMTFEDNVFGTDVRWAFGMCYADFTTQFSEASNVWRRNLLRVRPNTSPKPGILVQWTAADDGKYVWPDGTLHATDFET